VTTPVGVANPSIVLIRFSSQPAELGRPVLETRVDAEVVLIDQADLLDPRRLDEDEAEPPRA
jgi:hypothetical protein